MRPVPSGHLGGLAAMWNPNVINFRAFTSVAGIILSGFQRGSTLRFQLINVYAPFTDRKGFWDRVDGSGIMDLSSLILAGNFNVTLEVDEVWGTHCRPDNSGQFQGFFSLINL